jgi:hypothetical protein
MRPIYRLGFAGKLFAQPWIRGGIVQQKHGRRRGLWLVAIAAIMVMLLFFFEWLGSEQSQKWVESPIAVPVDDGGAVKQRQ